MARCNLLVFRWRWYKFDIQDFFFFPPQGISDWHHFHQRLRIRVLRSFKYRRPWANFNNSAQIHYPNLMADTLYDRHVMADKQKRPTKLGL